MGRGGEEMWFLLDEKCRIGGVSEMKLQVRT